MSQFHTSQINFPSVSLTSDFSAFHGKEVRTGHVQDRPTIFLSFPARNFHKPKHSKDIFQVHCFNIEIVRALEF